MKHLLLIITILFLPLSGFSQKVEVAGKVTDETNGKFVIEIVVNDTLAKVATDPNKGRIRYMKMYQNPELVVRTDSTGTFKIKALPTDTLYFKSYGHTVKAFRVSDLLKQKDVHIKLEREPETAD